MIVLDDYIDVAAADVVDWAPVLALTPKDGDIEKLYAALKDKHPALAVYRSSEIPAEYRLAGHPRLPAVVRHRQRGLVITSKAERPPMGRDQARRAPGGAHGYDARAPSMQGLFIASGPRIRRGMRVKPFENIHVYEFMCAVLGLQPAKNDGDPAVTRDMLLSQSMTAHSDRITPPAGRSFCSPASAAPSSSTTSSSSACSRATSPTAVFPADRSARLADPLLRDVRRRLPRASDRRHRPQPLRRSLRPPRGVPLVGVHHVGRHARHGPRARLTRRLASRPAC